MPRRSLFQSRVYRVACACCFSLLGFVVARAPLWNPALAGARAKLGAGQVALVPSAWRCSESPFTCSTTVAGEQLVARFGAVGDRPITCAATFRGEPVACNVWLWYAPRLKPFLELGLLPGVSFTEAMLERPWRVLDLGLLGEEGPLHAYAGLACSFLLAIGAGALIRGGGFRWILRVAAGAVTFPVLNGAWFVLCVFLGYID